MFGSTNRVLHDLNLFPKTFYLKKHTEKVMCRRFISFSWFTISSTSSMECKVVQGWCKVGWRVDWLNQYHPARYARFSTKLFSEKQYHKKLYRETLHTLHTIQQWRNMVYYGEKMVEKPTILITGTTPCIGAILCYRDAVFVLYFLA